MKKYQEKIMFTMWIFIIALICIEYKATAAPSFRQELTITQPSGEKFNARRVGDEKFNYLVGEKGEIIVEGENNFWYYGEIKNNELTYSNNKYKIDKTPGNLLNEKDYIVWNKHKNIINNKINRSISELSESSIISNTLSSPQVFTDRPRKILVLLVDFSDISIKNSEDAWKNKFFGTSGNTVNNYYKAQSNSKFYFTPAEESYGTVNNGVVKVKLNYSHPNTASNITYDNMKIVEDALSLADNYVDFSKYDVNGDGNISSDEVIVVTIIAGYERSVSSMSPSVWGHQYSLFGQVALDGKRIMSNYAQFGEMHDNHIATIGIMCHELGHTLGLPDLYDYDRSSGGVGFNSLMDVGSWGGYPAGETPVDLDAWSKVFLKFVNPVTVTLSGTFTLNSEIGKYNVIKIPTKDPKQYFLLENREFNGFDKSLQLMYERGGIAIWHVDESVMEKTHYYGINDNEKHKGLDFEEGSESFLKYSQLDINQMSYTDDYFHHGVNADTFSDYLRPSSEIFDSNEAHCKETGIEVKILDASSVSMRAAINLNGTLALRGGLDADNNYENLSGMYTLNGWVLNGQGVSKISMFIDGSLKGEGKYGVFRQDIYEKHPQYHNKMCGFYCNVNTAELSKGLHNVDIKVTDNKGQVTLLNSKTIYVANPEKDLLRLLTIKSGALSTLNNNGSIFIDKPTGGEFFIVGNSGQILTSVDGVNWKQKITNIDKSSNLYGIAYGAGKYVITGDKGRIYSSKDGVNWTCSTIGTDTSLVFYNVTYGGEKFIAVGNNGTVVTSIDGASWTKGKSGIAKALRGITYGAGQYVAVGDDNYILTSQNGLDWSVKNYNLGYGTIYCVTYAEGKFIAAQGCRVITSADGISWTSSLTTGTNNDVFNSIAYGNNMYIATCARGGATIVPKYFVSNNGVNWSNGSMEATTNNLSTVTFGNGKFIVGGEAGYLGAISLRPNLVSISPYSSENNISIYKRITITFSENIQLAGGQSNISLKDGKGNIIECYKTASGNTLTLTPNVPLRPNTVYNLYIGESSLKDMFGNLYSGKSTSNFKTVVNYMPEDINKDNLIDIKDIAEAAKNYNTNCINSTWKDSLDLNYDNIVDIYDLLRISKWIN